MTDHSAIYSAYIAGEGARIEEQHRVDLYPCPVCGGDRLRPNYSPELAFASTRPCHVTPERLVNDRS